MLQLREFRREGSDVSAPLKQGVQARMAAVCCIVRGYDKGGEGGDPLFPPPPSSPPDPQPKHLPPYLPRFLLPPSSPSPSPITL